MSRHVVLLRRDPSLGLALRALLHGTGRVTELLTIQAWSALAAETVDAVVIDLPTPRRTQAIDLVRSAFDGRLVLVLDPSDDPAAVPSHHACSIVQRPFEIVELWHLVTTDPASNGEQGPVGRGAGEGRPAGEGPGPAGSKEQGAGSAAAEGAAGAAAAGAGSGAARRPRGAAPGPADEPAVPPAAREPDPARPAATRSGERGSAATDPDRATPRGPDAASADPSRAPAAPEAPGEARPPDTDASTWRWRGRRYGPATAIPPGEEHGPGGAQPGARTGDPTRTAGPSAPAAPRHPGPRRSARIQARQF